MPEFLMQQVAALEMAAMADTLLDRSGQTQDSFH
jgi:hypothetical protein